MTTATPLRAGTQTGSLHNHIISGSNMSEPQVGMGATILYWTDRNAATITEVGKSGKIVRVVEDVAIRTDENGMSDSQTYRYEPGTGSPRTFTLRKNGAWVEQGSSMKGTRLAIGARRHYYDYSF
jgi:hypothetical protein